MFFVALFFAQIANGGWPKHAPHILDFWPLGAAHGSARRMPQTRLSNFRFLSSEQRVFLNCSRNLPNLGNSAQLTLASKFRIPSSDCVFDFWLNVPSFGHFGHWQIDQARLSNFGFLSSDCVFRLLDHFAKFWPVRTVEHGLSTRILFPNCVFYFWVISPSFGHFGHWDMDGARLSNFRFLDASPSLPV